MSENHHAATVFRLMANSELNLLAGMSRADKEKLRRVRAMPRLVLCMGHSTPALDSLTPAAPLLSLGLLPAAPLVGPR